MFAGLNDGDYKTTRLQVFFKDAETQRRKDAKLLIVME